MVSVEFEDIVQIIKESNLSIFRFDKYLTDEQREVIKSIITQTGAPILNFEIFDRYFKNPNLEYVFYDNLIEVVKYFNKYKKRLYRRE